MLNLIFFFCFLHLLFKSRQLHVLGISQGQGASLGKDREPPEQEEASYWVGDDLDLLRWKELLPGTVVQNLEQSICYPTYHENQAPSNYDGLWVCFQWGWCYVPHIFEQGFDSVQMAVWSYWRPWLNFGWRGLLLLESHMCGSQ